MTLLLVLIQYWEDHIIIYTNIRVHGLYNICASPVTCHVIMTCDHSYIEKDFFFFFIKKKKKKKEIRDVYTNVGE